MVAAIAFESCVKLLAFIAVGIIADRLRRLAAAGAIVMLATHDLDMAEGLVSRVALIRGGRLLADEPATAGLRAQYRALIGAY
jgi:ABC-type multidrug transport system ATPase subunit